MCLPLLDLKQGTIQETSEFLCEAFEAHLSKQFVYSVSVHIANHVMEFASIDFSAARRHVGDITPCRSVHSFEGTYSLCLQGLSISFVYSLSSSRLPPRLFAGFFCALRFDPEDGGISSSAVSGLTIQKSTVGTPNPTS
jgi:hypothetical protein